jgi:hypothetical protein
MISYDQEKDYVRRKACMYDALIAWCRDICHTVAEEGAVSMDRKVEVARRTHHKHTPGYTYNIKSSDKMDGRFYEHKVTIHLSQKKETSIRASLWILWSFRNETDAAATRADFWVSNPCDCDVEILWNRFPEEEMHLEWIGNSHSGTVKKGKRILKWTPENTSGCTILDEIVV